MHDAILDTGRADERPDIVVINNDLVVDSGVVTAVLAALFTDARASADDDLPPGADLRGHWGDTFTDAPLGSLLWLVNREKITPDLIPRIHEYAATALQRGVVDKGYATGYEVDVTRTGLNRIALFVAVDVPPEMQNASTQRLEISGLDVLLVIRVDRAMHRMLAHFEDI